jgi:hypothetical protein
MTKIVPAKIKDLDVPVSSKIRYLTSQGYSRSDISKMLDVRYQWVRNVQLQECKKLDLTSEIEEIGKMLHDTDQLDLGL